MGVGAGGLLQGLGTGLVNRAKQDNEDVDARRDAAIVEARDWRQAQYRLQEQAQSDTAASQRAAASDTSRLAEREVDRTARASERQDDRQFQEQLHGKDRDLQRELKGAEPPRTREVKRGDSTVTEEWDMTNRAWREVGTSARGEGTPTYARFLVPLAEKLATGGELSPGEQRAVDLLQRTGAIDRVIGQAFNTRPGSGGAARQGTATPATPGTDADSQQLLRDARDAISQGVDRKAVLDRLRQLNIDPDAAGL